MNCIQNFIPKSAAAKHVKAADRIRLVDAVFVNVCTVHATSLFTSSSQCLRKLAIPLWNSLAKSHCSLPSHL